MRMNVLDGQTPPQAQTILVHAQEAPVDKSGSIAATSTAQNMLTANANRAGWFMQNTSGSTLYVNEAKVATSTGDSFAVPAGGTFPPPGFPVTTGAVSVLGTQGQTFAAREW